MIYTALTNKAMKLAYDAHHGQVDKAGMPYIFHPFCLANQMDDEISTCVALLHDVVEDTSITMDDLRKEFPDEVIEVLEYLTHDKAVPYDCYIQKILEHPIAMKVKLADIEHNANQDRFQGMDVSQEMLQYFQQKYDKAKKTLLNGWMKEKESVNEN